METVDRNTVTTIDQLAELADRYDGINRIPFADLCECGDDSGDHGPTGCEATNNEGRRCRCREYQRKS